MKSSTIQCVCGEELFFLNELISNYENYDERKHNKKPLEMRSGKVHECQKRGWSIVVKCNRCGEPIQFNNAMTSASGAKIPYGINGKRHQCMRTIA